MQVARCEQGTYYTWNRKYTGMESDDVKRLHELAARKRIVAEHPLTMDVTRKLLRETGVRPRATIGGQVFNECETVEAKACKTIGISRRGYGLATLKGDRDAELLERHGSPT